MGQKFFESSRAGMKVRIFKQVDNNFGGDWFDFKHVDTVI